MADFIIRQAVREDLPVIRSLIRTVRINPTGLSWQHFYIAVTPQGELLACGQIKPHNDGSLELASIAVQEHARGQGIAREIIEVLLAHEKSRPLYLMCRARLGLLYEKFGFHAARFDEMPPYFRRISRAERMLNRKSRLEDRLLVMQLD